MTDYDEVLDECQRLADYWMNEQDVYDVEVVPRADEYRVVLTLKSVSSDHAEWLGSWGEVEDYIESHLYRFIPSYN